MGDQMTEPTFRGYTLSQAIDGLKAYDSGALDSGLKDEELRAWVVATLNAMSLDENRRTLAVVARHMLTDEAIEAGYGLEDVWSLIDWLKEQDCF